MKSKFVMKQKRGTHHWNDAKQLLLVLSIKEERAYWKRREVVSRPSLITQECSGAGLPG